MNIVIDKRYKWKHTSEAGLRYWYMGSKKTAKKFANICQKPNLPSLDVLQGELSHLSGNFGIIVHYGKKVFAVADRKRSYPIFYVHQGRTFALSNSARALRDELDLSDIDGTSLLEFRMAGYVTGRETLYKDLYQLQAGEVILWYAEKENVSRDRYYLFYSEEVLDGSEDDLIDELDGITDRAFYRTMEEANGSPIWVPLSGGLDSRLVLCKLKQLGYDNLKAYSYGPKGNYEARAAKDVAEKVGVPWYFVPSRRTETRSFFWSEGRRRYWDFADGLYVVPNIHWIDSIKRLSDEGLITKDVVFINGQSGDFVQGDHIPKIDSDIFNIDVLCDSLLQKHFSLLASYLKKSTYLRKVKDKIIKTIKSCLPISIGGYEDLARYYELWEWQERQCKRVINGQRTYDFFSYSWKLPLWDDEYLFYWEKIPLKYKLGRYLFLQYLDKKDFYGVFKGFKPTMSRWPGKLIIIQYTGKGIKLLFGEASSTRYYKILEYFSQYSRFYAPFGYLDYLKSCQNIKGVFPLFERVWEQENFQETAVLASGGQAF